MAVLTTAIPVRRGGPRGRPIVAMGRPQGAPLRLDMKSWITSKSGHDAQSAQKARR